MKLAKRSNIAPSLTLAMNTKAKQMRAKGIDVISFAAGEPDFPTPEHVKEELIQVLQKKLKFTVIEVFDIILALPIKWIEAEIFEDEVELAAGLISHKKDIPILACALALGIDVLSGDKHFQNIIL